MAKDIEIGTIYKNTKHGHCEFMLVENEFINPCVYYEGERLPWSSTKVACAVCGRYNGHQHFCGSTQCMAERREDGKDVYWKLISVGHKVKKEVTDENIAQFIPAWKDTQFYRKGVHDEHPCKNCEKFLADGVNRRKCESDCAAKIAYDKKYAEEIWHQRNCTRGCYYEAHKEEHDKYRVYE